MKKLFSIASFFVFQISLLAQSDSIQSHINFEGDFRFRIEHDWDVRQPDGTFKDDRSRLRYRFRFGGTYSKKWYETGFRLRTGNPRKQQDPQLTIGNSFQEFGTLLIGLEKAYFKSNFKSTTFWIGKNTFPFKKNNELFWSDNVFPDGAFIGQGFKINVPIIDSVNLKIGHFIMSASGKLFNEDSYFQGYQTYFSLLNHRLELFPSLYIFKNIPHIPDGFETFKLDYTILHGGSHIKLLTSKPLHFEFDYYYNLHENQNNDSIPVKFRDQNTGFVAGLKYGKLAEKGNWLINITYAWLQKYAAIDFMAQNDWARWDYSSYNSPDGRLTNFNGVEVVLGYKINQRINLVTKCYFVEQLVALGSVKETNNRIRFDLDIKF